MSDAPLFAHLVLLAIVPFTWYAFRRRPMLTASLWVIFGAVLFGPEHAYFKAPALPPFTKQTIPFVCVLVAISLKNPGTIRAARPFRGLDLVALTPTLTAALTALTNADELQFGTVSRTFCPPMAITDGIALGLSWGFSIWLPFFVGRILVQDGADLRSLLRTIAGFGLLYALFMLYEIRFSPQLHRMIYGYMAHPEFGQTIRWGGYRPMVFMEHGLAVALFTFVTWAAAVSTMRDGTPKISRWRSRNVAIFLTLMVVLSKSTGAIGYMALCFIPLIWLRARTIMFAATVGASLVMLYPLLRATDLFPTMDIYDFVAKNIDQERADSILFRFANEDMLLSRARERLMWGWGYFGRNQVYDSVNGRLISVTDGFWIIILGVGGAAAALASFGTLLAPVYASLARLKRIPKNDKIIVASFGLIVSIVTIDLVPNGLFSIYPFFFSGALWGYLSHVGHRTRATQPANPQPARL